MAPKPLRDERRAAPGTRTAACRAASETPIPAQRRAPAVPAQREPIDDTPISVTSLLRREGRRVPHAADRPLQPRAHQLRTPEPEATATPVASAEPWFENVTIRRAGAAAGALVAAASVFGAAVLTDATGGGSNGDLAAPQITDGGGAPAIGTLPALGLLGPLDAVPGSDVGVGGPVSLAAFSAPGAGAGVPSTSFLTAAVAPPGVGAPGAGGGVPGPTPGSGTGNGTGGGSTPSPSASSGPVQSTVSALTSPVKGLTDAVGDAAPTPLRAPLKSLGGAVQDTGDALGGTVDTVTEPLIGAVTGLLGGRDSDERREPATSKVDGASLTSNGGKTSNGGSSGGGGLVGLLGQTASGLLG